jgi:hypothetical protein
LNENIIQFDYVVPSLATVTAQVMKPDSTIRDSQSGVILTDSSAVGRYTNLGAITVQAGDSFRVLIGGSFVTSAEYRPESRAVALLTTIASVLIADTKFVLTDGPAIADILINAVIMITDISTGFSIPRRIIAYTAGREVTIDIDAKISLAPGDVVTVWGDSYEGELGSVAAAQVADAVWDEPAVDHKAQSTMGLLQQTFPGRLK